MDRLFQFLPEELRQKDNSDEKKNTGPDKPKKPRTEDWWLNAALTTEWNYRFIPPAGFVPKELPKDATIALGPALLTEKFTDGKGRRGAGAPCLRFREAPLHRGRGYSAAQPGGRSDRRPRDPHRL